MMRLKPDIAHYIRKTGTYMPGRHPKPCNLQQKRPISSLEILSIVIVRSSYFAFESAIL